MEGSDQLEIARPLPIYTSFDLRDVSKTSSPHSSPSLPTSNSPVVGCLRARTMAAAHNSSPQTHVAANDDPALDLSREHYHAPLHHDPSAMKGHKDEIAYTYGTTVDPPSIPGKADVHHRHTSEKSTEKQGVIDIDDAEKGSTSPVTTARGEEGKKRGPVGRFYSRFRLFFHLFIWLLFTGYVVPDFFTLFKILVSARVACPAVATHKNFQFRRAAHLTHERERVLGLTVARQMVGRQLGAAPA